ncbi:type 1 periplasmic-binding domain-containing protein [Micromonospora rifamycinica]|uniref:ABC-type branched-chain amino acid transport system, substrate-binding protein n=1 Tax=Micromonospora rifamycinica TaxID=291594 RepID=A0A1C5KEF6_9ACTN|nr:hypothetical protein [Micromonospora rifamycinica]SCG81130.1 hypothetical protein GA0070623_5503 [Micromonospora rifamycinica]
MREPVTPPPPRPPAADDPQPRPPTADGPPVGGAELLALLTRLLRRPRRDDRRLPVLWLVRAATGGDPGLLLRRFVGRGAGRQVPHAVLDLAARPDLADVPALLRELRRQLSLEAFGAARLRFRHYPLADWLMQQTLEVGVDGAGSGRANLVRRLRDRRGQRPVEEPQVSGESGVGTALQVLLWLLRRAVPSVVFRIAVSGRVPAVGSQYRWFMRQQYLAPRQSVTFLGFAERLTAGWRDGEQPAQVDKLLLHAFLEDLRQAYRRRVWRPGDWRRTAYPVLLLDGVTVGGVGHTLVRLLNDVRNETGRNDPLLVVALAAEPPPETPGTRPLREADKACDEWAEAVSETRRLRRPAAWLVVLRPDADDATPPRGAVPPALVAPDPPWWSRRFLPAAVVLVLLAGVGVWADSRWTTDCHPALAGQVRVRLIAEECVGYSDHAAQVFNSEPGQERLRAVQRRIFAQNRAAEEVWRRSDHRRPYLTLVYLGTLTGNRTRPDEESYVSEREELEGLATAQYALLKESAAADGAALLHVVVANGGRQMRHAGPAVAMLEELAHDDPTVLGVVGLVESRASTASALRELNRVGLPVLAPTLSADRMSQNSSLYLQVSAPNADQARMIEVYARQVLRVTEAHVYYTTGERSSLTEDLYVGTLVDGLRQRFGTRLTRLDEWSVGRRLTSECGYQGVLVFAGRWSEFDGFLRALKECGGNPPRHLVGDDSVNRYMANPGLRVNAPGNLPVTYVSKAALATCAVLRAAQAAGDDARGSFLNWVGSADLLDPPRCRDGAGVPVGERVSLAYDAAMMMVRAVESLAARLRHADPGWRWDPHAVNPVGVHAEVLRQNAATGYPGVAGVIRYAPDSGEPVAKRLALLRVARVPDVAAEPVEVFHCGAADGGPDPGCRPV